MTLWSPDTCSCQIEYSDDGNATYIATHNVCAKHAAVANSTQHLVDVQAHNGYKTTVYRWLVDNADSFALPPRVTRQGNKAWDFILQYNPNAPVGNDPLLFPISQLITTITPQKIAQLQAAADARFGVGKVLVS